MKFETILNAYEATCQRYGYLANEYGEDYELRRRIDAFRARLLSMYSMDTLRRLEQSRYYWQRRAYLADQDNRDLRARLEGGRGG